MEPLSGASCETQEITGCNHGLIICSLSIIYTAYSHSTFELDAWTKTAGDKQNFSLQHHVFIHFPCEIREKGTGTQKYLKDTQSCLHGLIYNWTNSQNVCCDILKWNILKERYIYQTLTTKNAKTHYLHSLLWSSGRHSYRWHCLETLQNIPHISKRRHHPLLFPLILLLIFP